MAPAAGLPCPAIVGPTAVGKTALVTALAHQLPVEVISLDSRQIYHGLRIGTAQPSGEEQAQCPHHLIDFISPDEKYDAVRFREDFSRVYDRIKGRGGVPLLVGGAGLYLKGLREGFLKIPGNSPAGLQAAREEVLQWEPDFLREKLREVDPDSYHRIHANDRYRQQRAMEIYLLAGQTMTELMAAQKPDPCLGLGFPAFVLDRPVGELDERIARRTESMLQQGWIEETETALARHDRNGPGLRSIGYREIVDHLEGRLPRNELARAIVLATRQYAKRQRTWFRNIAHAERGTAEQLAVLVLKVLD